MKDSETKIVQLMSVTERPEGYVMCVRGEEQARQTGKGEGREEGKAGGREEKRKEERKQERGKEMRRKGTAGALKALARAADTVTGPVRAAG